MTVDKTATDNTLAENIVHFCHALRKANVKVSTAQLENTLRAIEVTGIGNRTDFFYSLQSTLVSSPEDREVFSQLFKMFWRDLEFLQNLLWRHTPEASAEHKIPPAERRATQALTNGARFHTPAITQERDATSTLSEQEVLRSKDFEQMSTSEIKEAEQIVKTLVLKPPALASRRSLPDHSGKLIDAGATLRKAMQQMGDIQQLQRRSRRTKKPGLVVICDISGSMSVYSRMFMRFAHALTHNKARPWSSVSVFTFSTKLTNVTSAVRHNDTDIALSRIGIEANDWEGGTLIGSTIRQFNRAWARRLLNRGAALLLITDGLERGDPTLLSHEMARLHLHCRSIIWLNPLLRWDGFSPQASGIKAMLPHVDHFHACHSLTSLSELAKVLNPVYSRHPT